MATGFLTEKQIQVLRLRSEGLTQAEVAKQFGTTRVNVSIVERRARDNIRRARETLLALKTFKIAVSVVIEPGTHMVDIPRILLNRADEANIKVTSDFLKILKDIKAQAKKKVRGVRAIKPIPVRIMQDGHLVIE